MLKLQASFVKKTKRTYLLSRSIFFSSNWPPEEFKSNYFNTLQKPLSKKKSENLRKGIRLHNANDLGILLIT